MQKIHCQIYYSTRWSLVLFAIAVKERSRTAPFDSLTDLWCTYLWNNLIVTCLKGWPFDEYETYYVVTLDLHTGNRKKVDELAYVYIHTICVQASMRPSDRSKFIMITPWSRSSSYGWSCRLAQFFSDVEHAHNWCRGLESQIWIDWRGLGQSCAFSFWGLVAISHPMRNKAG
jgi:hypothetical protein